MPLCSVITQQTTMFSKLFIFASLIATASAACPNACSGHGSCGNQEVCTCYDNWGMGGQIGGDCSDRICPFEVAWVDKPNSEGNQHQFAECANKGICDRTSGECECLPGYTGKGCGRQVCPDDCSGHGTCEYMSSLGHGTVWGDSSTNIAVAGSIGAVVPTTEKAWDINRARACVCDAGYDGINCGNKICPYGNDALFVTAYQTTYLRNVQKVALTSALTLVGKTFALKFTTRLNETFTTDPIVISEAQATTATAVTNALLALPNKVIDGVTVTASGDLTFATSTICAVTCGLSVTFTGNANQGQMNLLELDTSVCGAGCNPVVTGLDLTVGTITETGLADFNSYECGRRGKCDYDTGLCACFTGFTGDNCNTITALI